MGYNPNCIDVTLGDVITSTHHHFDDMMDRDDWYPPFDDDWYNEEPEDDDRDAYFDGIDVDAEDPEALPPVDEHDPYEIILPFIGSVNVAWHRGRYHSKNEKRWCRRRPKYNSKPKRKNHRG